MKTVLIPPGESYKYNLVVQSELKKLSIQVSCSNVPVGEAASYKVSLVRAGEVQQEFVRNTSQLDILTMEMVPPNYDMDLNELIKFYVEISNTDTRDLRFVISEVRDYASVR